MTTNVKRKLEEDCYQHPSFYIVCKINSMKWKRVEIKDHDILILIVAIFILTRIITTWLSFCEWGLLCTAHSFDQNHPHYMRYARTCTSHTSLSTFSLQRSFDTLFISTVIHTNCKCVIHIDVSTNNMTHIRVEMQSIVFFLDQQYTVLEYLHRQFSVDDIPLTYWNQFFVIFLNITLSIVNKV